MEPIGDNIDQRGEQLGLWRADELKVVQRYLDGKYPNKARATSLNGGVLTIVTESAPVASELRFGQRELTALSRHIKSVRIRIG